MPNGVDAVLCRIGGWNQRHSRDNLAQAIRQGASQASARSASRSWADREYQPTITIRPGFPVRVLVTHDLVLEPYRGGELLWQAQTRKQSRTTSLCG